MSRSAPLIQGERTSARGIRAGMPPQGEVQIVAGVAPLDHTLQHGFRFQGLPQALEGKGGGGAQALRRIQFVFRHMAIASYLPRTRRFVPYRYDMQPGGLL